MAGQRFERKYRIRREADFRRVFRQRSAVSDDRLVVFGLANGLPHARLGLAVSRKLGKAVVRNRWKRLIREAFRLAREQLPSGVDLVVIPKEDADPELPGVTRSLVHLADRVARKAGVALQ